MPELGAVLIANRGEIAVRVARACRDAGIRSIAVYADPDRDALHVRVADEAYALGGSTPGDSYLVIDKILDVARRSGADGVHPGYGFLSENAGFAQAVIDAGLVWIGPPPAAIDALGDKVKARHIAERVGAPLVPGTKDPVSGADEVVAFAREHGLPVAIKAAYGGGGRGLKVVRTLEEIPHLYDSAVREAEAGYVGAGTCEFLVGPDGSISFLEVNTRLQVEHCVSEEVTGLDLVREQFRLAVGEPLGYGDPQHVGHSFEFRINGEDAGRNFLPQPGVVAHWQPPGGPGVRLDSGVVEGSVVGGAFDS